MTSQSAKPKEDFEALFARTTASFFFREFCFSRTEFTPPGGSEIELADFALQLRDIFMVFQLKERANATTDPQRERSWFESKILKKASKQVRDTVTYLRDHGPEIANDRGRAVAFPRDATGDGTHKIVVFRPSEHLPEDCRNYRFHDSKTTGLIHILASADWNGIITTLITPREIADYLAFRTAVCRRHPELARATSERALVGQFLDGSHDLPPSAVFTERLNQLADDEESFDLRKFLNLFGDRLTEALPAGALVPRDLQSANSDYYDIFAELALFTRSDLKLFKERLMIAWRDAGQEETEGPAVMRFVASTGTGFVILPIPPNMTSHMINGLANFVMAHMYDQKIRRCVGAAIDRDGQHRNVVWLLRDHEWKHDPACEEWLKSSPLPSVRSREYERYTFIVS